MKKTLNIVYSLAGLLAMHLILTLMISFAESFGAKLGTIDLTDIASVGWVTAAF